MQIVRTMKKIQEVKKEYISLNGDMLKKIRGGEGVNNDQSVPSQKAPVSGNVNASEDRLCGGGCGKPAAW